MKPHFDQVDQIGEEITLQALQAISRAVDTRAEDAFSAIVLFNPHSAPCRDTVEVALNIPETVTAFELLDTEQTVIPHEFIGSSNEELANLLLPKSSLRDTIGAINEGRVAGAAIVSVRGHPPGRHQHHCGCPGRKGTAQHSGMASVWS